MPESVSANNGTAITQRKTTHFKEILKPSTLQRDIYVKFDVLGVDTDLEFSDDKVATSAAGAQPLVRIGDYLITPDKILYLAVEVGESFLPRISITFEDSDYKFRKVMTSKMDFITVYIGNTKDPYYTKQEYVLANISAYPDSPDISVGGYLYIPEFYQIHTRWFGPDNDMDTVWKITKFICEECHLGFWTNIDETDDSQVWLQDNCTTLDFFRKIQQHAYTSQDTRLLFFIDQYDYLNLIDLSKAYGNREIEYTAFHPYMHTPLSEDKEVILSSRRFSRPEGDADMNPFQIKHWTQLIYYGSNAEALPHAIQRNEMGMSELPFVVTTGELQTNTELIPHKWYIQPIWSDVHPFYNSINTEKDWVAMHYQQGDQLSVEMQFANMLLYPYQYVPVQIWIDTTRAEFQEADKPTEENAEKNKMNEDPEVSAKVQELNRFAETLDELHSGDYIITSIRYEYRPSDNNACYQFLKLSRLLLEDVPEQVKV